MRYLSVIGWVYANMDLVSLDDPRFAEWLEFMDPEVYRVVRDRIDRERAAERTAGDSNLDSNPGGCRRSSADGSHPR